MRAVENGPESSRGKTLVDTSAVDASRNYLQFVQGLRRSAVREGATDLPRLLDLERKAIRAFADLNGELNRCDPAYLAETKQYRKFRAALLNALVPHPEASRDVLAVLEELGA